MTKAGRISVRFRADSWHLADKKQSEVGISTKDARYLNLVYYHCAIAHAYMAMALTIFCYRVCSYESRSAPFTD